MGEVNSHDFVDGVIAGEHASIGSEDLDYLSNELSDLWLLGVITVKPVSGKP